MPDFMREINKKINKLMLDNKKHISNGNMSAYQNNCNVLKGIAYAVEQYKKCR